MNDYCHLGSMRWDEDGWQPVTKCGMIIEEGMLVTFSLTGGITCPACQELCALEVIDHVLGDEPTW